MGEVALKVALTTLVCPTILIIPAWRRLPNVGRTYWNAFFHESLLQWFGLLALGLRWPSHPQTTEWWRVHLFSHFEECSLVKFLGISFPIQLIISKLKSKLNNHIKCIWWVQISTHALSKYFNLKFRKMWMWYIYLMFATNGWME